MQFSITKLLVTMQSLMLREEGQDLVEWSLMLALVALAATTGMKSMASSISNVFTNISATLGTTVG